MSCLFSIFYFKIARRIFKIYAYKKEEQSGGSVIKINTLRRRDFKKVL